MKGGHIIYNYRFTLKIDTSTLDTELMGHEKHALLKRSNVNKGNSRHYIEKMYYPNLYKLFQAIIALPVNSVTCKRSSSGMSMIKKKTFISDLPAPRK